MMKKYRLLLLVPVLLLTMLSGADAGVRAGSMSLSPFIGGYSFLGRDKLDTMPVFGLRGGYNVTKNFGVEGVADYIFTEADSGSDVHVMNFHLDVLYHFMPDSVLVPYLAAGFGGQQRWQSGGDDTLGAFNYGAGAKFFLNEDMAVRGDVRHIIMRDDSIRLHNLEYTVGLDFLFGGEREAAAAAQPVAQPVEEEPALGPVPAAEPEPGRFKYCITMQGEFDVDKAEIRPEHYEDLARVAEFMKKYPDTTAVIEGHTDNVGDAQYNVGLSERRAQAAVDHLVSKYGVDRSRLSARGFGETRPIATNDTDEGKQQNRRMEAIIDCAFDVAEVQPPDRLCIGTRLQFDSGKAEIKPEYRGELDKVGEYMKRYPTTTGLIEGHTDNVGGYDMNMKLSQQRAENVVDYLVQNHNIDRSRLSAKGFGYTRRVAYNRTAEGRAKNRRINAVIDCVVRK